MYVFKWEKGRQNTGYDKMQLFKGSWPIKWDIYILRYPQGSYIPPHTDPAPTGKRHYRLNIILRQTSGGKMHSRLKPIIDFSRLILFRPDISEHWVDIIISGNRYVLSIGWLA